MSTRPDGKTLILIGVSRSGKSTLAKRVAEQAERCIAFCPKGEYHSQFNFEKITDKRELIRRVVEVGSGPARINFVASNRKDFDFFCGAAFIFNMYAQALIVCEELALYTNPGKADGNWGRLTNQSLAYGPVIIGTVQRGQEVDKTVINNATLVHVLRHGTDDDREYISKKLGVPLETVPKEKLKFFQWTSSNGVVCEGSIDFPASKKNEYWPEGIPRFRTNGKNRKTLPVAANGLFDGIKYA